jgi:hypothetical protein
MRKVVTCASRPRRQLTRDLERSNARLTAVNKPLELQAERASEMHYDLADLISQSA